MQDVEERMKGVYMRQRRKRLQSLKGKIALLS